MTMAGSRILEGARQARAFAEGGDATGFVVHHAPDADVRAIRAKLGLSQEAFAARFGLSIAALREWEQRRRRPEQAARVLLLVIAHNPGAVSEALAAAAA